MDIMILICKIVYIKSKFLCTIQKFVINNITLLVLAITSCMYKDYYLYESTHRICFSYINFFLLFLSVILSVTFISSLLTYAFSLYIYFFYILFLYICNFAKRYVYFSLRTFVFYQGLYFNLDYTEIITFFFYKISYWTWRTRK